MRNFAKFRIAKFRIHPSFVSFLSPTWLCRPVLPGALLSRRTLLRSPTWLCCPDLTHVVCVPATCSAAGIRDFFFLLSFPFAVASPALSKHQGEMGRGGGEWIPNHLGRNTVEVRKFTILQLWVRLYYSLARFRGGRFVLYKYSIVEKIRKKQETSVQAHSLWSLLF